MENNIQDNIRWGQSWNLAVEMTSAIKQRLLEGVKREEAIKIWKEEIGEWQRWFWEQLKDGPPEVCSSCGGTASVGTGGEKIVKGMHPSCRRSEGFKKNNL